MTGKTMLFEIILITKPIVGLDESRNYLNESNMENYSQTDLINFAFMMVA
jgi:hypothetical protein